jgi:hypothetical protein
MPSAGATKPAPTSTEISSPAIDVTIARSGLDQGAPHAAAPA